MGLGERRRGRSIIVPLLALCVLAPLAGCGFSNLLFVADHRLHFVGPKSRALVAEPVTLSWTIRDFTVVRAGYGAPSRHAGYFAVFIDRAPIRPGQTVKAIASGDSSCRRTPGCPDAQYLADRGVYTTDKLSITLDQVTPLRSKERTQTHEAIIVLLDSSGHRIGESAWYRDFRMKKRTL